MKMKAIEVKIDVGEHPTICDHCGADDMLEIGLVAPKCGTCGRFSLSHMNFLPPTESEIEVVW